jgi:hypothetical protein
MFSQEALVYMADGSKRNINSLRVGEMILNKFRNPVKVNRVIKKDNVPAIAVQLDNGTGLFYTTIDTLVLCHYGTDGSYVSKFDTIEEVHLRNGQLKNSIKVFSPESDVEISNYDTSNSTLTKTMYNIQTIDSTNSYFMNGVIVKSLNL